MKTGELFWERSGSLWYLQQRHEYPGIDCDLNQTIGYVAMSAAVQPQWAGYTRKQGSAWRKCTHDFADVEDAKNYLEVLVRLESA